MNSATRAMDFIERQTKADKPFFVWFNTTHMHFRTHTKPESVGQPGAGSRAYHDTMIDHDEHVGSMLDLLDELGIADNTIVMYSTDNGPHMNSWPDGGMTPFRNEKNSNWEGAYRVPAHGALAGPHQGRVRCSNEIVSHDDWLPRCCRRRGCRTSPSSCARAQTWTARPTRCTSTGYNQLPYITGETDESPRKHFFYCLRRRRPHRTAVRQLEVRLPRAALRGHPADLGGAVG